MANKAWPLKIFFERSLCKLFKCYVYVKNFDRKPGISLKTLKIGFFNMLAVTKTTSKYIAGLPDSFKDKCMNGKSNYRLKSL